MGGGVGYQMTNTQWKCLKKKEKNYISSHNFFLNFSTVNEYSSLQ